MTERPTHSIKEGSVELHLSPGWTYTITGISRQTYHHLVTIHSSLYPDSKVRLRSTWGKIDDVMKDHYNSTQRSAVMDAQIEPATITLDFYYSTTKVKLLNIPSIQDPANRSHRVQVVLVDKPASASKTIPDYMTLFIFVLDSPDSEAASINDMVLTVNLVYRPLGADDFFDEPENKNPDPPPPPPNTKPGYNQLLDIRRPIAIENYLEYYDTTLLIDDSGSMSGARWRNCIAAVVATVETALDNGAYGIDIHFLNSDNVFAMKDEVQNVADKAKIKAALARVKPSGGTPTGERLAERFQERLAKMDGASGNSFRDIKPWDLIVITDGCPNNNDLCKAELEKAAKHLQDNNYHPNSIGVQFVQIGGEEEATKMLKELAEADVKGMVDTLPYKDTLSAEEMKRILLGGTHPNLR